MISIIIPVYNAQKSISLCLQSIINQTYKDIEIICIDDGSNDDSLNICQQYSKQDKRLNVYHIEHLGVSSARNYGLDRMHGDWFAFIDSDDCIESNYLETLFRNACEYNCDLSVCGFKCDYNNKIKKSTSLKNKVEIFATEKERIQNYIYGVPSMHGMTWNKLYLSKVFGDLRFNIDLKKNEDCLYTFYIMKKSNRACYVDDKLYNFHIHGNSLSHRKSTINDFSAADVFLILLKEISQYCDDDMNVKLKMNYVNSVVKILIELPYLKHDTCLEEIKSRCILWKNDIWGKYTIKQKLKYFIAFYV